MAFTDDFNRSAENLEASADWTKVDGVAGAAYVTGAVVRCNSAQSTGSYHCPDQGSANHYTQVDFKVSLQPFGACTRITDGSNWIGLRHNSGDWQLFKRVSGSFSLLGSYTTSLVSGDTGYLESDSSDDHTVKINGTTRIGPVSDSFNNTETRQGIAPRGQAGNPWIDNFEAGALAPPAGGPPSDIYYKTLLSASGF